MVHTAQGEDKGVLCDGHTHFIHGVTGHLPQHQEVEADCEAIKEAGYCAAGGNKLDLGTKLQGCTKDRRTAVTWSVRAHCPGCI
jgi:hypothetical protein